jgi:hypothetical protein
VQQWFKQQLLPSGARAPGHHPLLLAASLHPLQEQLVPQQQQQLQQVALALLLGRVDRGRWPPACSNSALQGLQQ